MADGAVLAVALPPDLDAGALAELLPDVSLDALTPDSALALFELVLAQAAALDERQREADDARAELARRDVELEQAYQDRDAGARELETQLADTQRTLAETKTRHDALHASETLLRAQLASVTDTTTTSSSEIQTLRHKVADVEREKRELVGVVSRHKEDNAQLQEEITTLRSNLKQARQDHLSLETQLREVRSNETSFKFKVDSLSQQLDLARGECDRATSELAAKTEEFANYRRARQAELAALQAQNDTLAQQHAAASASLSSLQTAHSAQGHQLAQALARVHDLTGQLAERDAAYASEAAGLQRLVQMLEGRESAARATLDRIERDWAAVGDRADAREAALRADADEAAARADAAEARVRQLEATLSGVGGGALSLPGTPGAPGTPLRGTPGGEFGMFGLSPTVALASRTQKSGKTFTEVYSDYVRLQDEFAKKNAEYDHMERTLAGVIQQIEERAPLLQQQRGEFERSQQEASQLSQQLSHAIAERDAQAAAAQEAAQKLTKAERERALLERQTDDLGRQVQHLLRDIARRDDPTLPPDEIVDDDMAPAENTEELITNHLVLFRSIGALQVQNQRLLQITRDLGAKLEAEERSYRAEIEREQVEAVQEAHRAIMDLQERVDAQRAAAETTAAAHAQEVSTLRDMIARARAGHAVPLPAALGSHADADAASRLAEMRMQFDDMGEDAQRLHAEALAAQREVHRLEAELKKTEAKVQSHYDNYRIVQEDNVRLKREREDLATRQREVYQQCHRLEAEYARAKEDVVIAHNEADRLRNECANLRAEKKIWANVESRLADENKTLAMERSRLADLMTNVQKMHADLERSGENDRRRIENQLELLQSQTQDLRTQLSQERDALRSVTMQKEIELREYQSKHEKMMQEFAKTRELLVAAETSKKHLEQRVEDLSKHLEGNQEKLAVYERRPHAAAGAETTPSGLANGQHLEGELADLHAAKRLLEIDLANAKANVEQFQSIAQNAETALSSLTTTHEEYKDSAQSELTKLQSELAAAQSKITSFQQDLAQATARVSEIQQAADADRAAWLSDKRTLEDTIVDMSTSETDTDRAMQETVVRQLEERVKVAEERYNREVIGHADSLKANESLRTQLSAIQDSSRGNAAAAETAQAKLATSEGSWRLQKVALEKEVADLGARCKDLASQNSILHQHLEDVSSQAARIRQAADASSALPDGDPAALESSDKLDELRSVVSYLRKEKEIVDLQLELAKQENTRLKAQVEHLSQTLAETKENLTQERERAVQAAESEAQHAELLERINQLTILRESNATLRAECDRHEKRSREFETRLHQLTTELDPAKEQLRGAQAELEARDVQIQRLQQESAMWQERNRQLLSKYDRIDPAEMQSLKDDIEQLKKEKSEVDAAVSDLQTQVQERTQRVEQLEREKRALMDTGRKNNDIFKRRMEASSQEKTELTQSLATLQERFETLQSERDQLQARTEGGPTPDVVAALTAQVDELIRDKNALEKSLTEATAVNAVAAPSAEVERELSELREQRDTLLAEKETWSSSGAAAAASTEDGAAAAEAMKNWEAERQQLIAAKDAALETHKKHIAQTQKALRDANAYKSTVDKLQIQLRDTEKARAEEQQRREAAEAAVAAAAAAAAAAASSQPEVKTESVDGAVTDLVQKHAEELKALEARLVAKHDEELKAAVETASASASTSKADGKLSEAEIAAARESGRTESNYKLKLKEAQVVKLQAKLKEKEQEHQRLQDQYAQLLQLDAVPANSAPAGAKAGKAAAPAAAPAAPARAPLRKGSVPAVGATAAAPAAAVVPAAAGRGRGAARGRGATRVLPARGAAAAAAAAEAAGTSADELSITGAAAKRAREEGDGAADDGLAKRLKPADGPSKPVALRRPPPANPPPA